MRIRFGGVVHDDDGTRDLEFFCVINSIGIGEGINDKWHLDFCYVSNAFTFCMPKVTSSTCSKEWINVEFECSHI